MADYIVSIDFNPSLKDVGEAFTGDALNRELHQILTDYAMLVESYSKQVTPVDTGRLRASIGTSFLMSAGMERGGVARIAPHTDYAYWVHEGKRKMKARPFMYWGLSFAEKRMSHEIPARLNKALRAQLSRNSTVKARGF